MVKRRLFYFGLEPLLARYTKQLCEDWFPNAIKGIGNHAVDLVPVPGSSVSQDIRVGAVLDATGRGIYCCGQVAWMLSALERKEVRDGDIVFLQDFWTPGFESVVYAAQQYGIKLKVFSMLHAQSVDEYDFTYDMRHWMRPFELGMDAVHTAIFVGSTVHREQLRAAGFKAPIHVVGLPISTTAVEAMMPSEHHLPTTQRRKNVVFTSRFDREKNPDFMMSVAEQFLHDNPSWTWTVTTSAKEPRSNLPEVVDDLYALSARNPRFRVMAGITKEQYYRELANSRIQFNSSLQDYVSWTLLEACIAGCIPVYPDFRSFPEILPHQVLYQAFRESDALRVLSSVRTAIGGDDFRYIPNLCNRGRLIEARIVCGLQDHTKEVNIWQQLFR